MSDNPIRRFGVRSVYQHAINESELKFSYEERVILIRTDSFESAISLAESEAQDYIQDSKAIVLDYFNAFEIIADKIDSGAEVYSLIRDSNLEPEKYLDTFFETGNEYGH